MSTVIIVLTVIVSILLVLIVLVQKSKGGGLSSQFGGAGNVMGVRQTNSFLEKGTWTLIGLLVVLSIVSVWVTPRTTGDVQTRTAPTTTTPASTLPAAGDISTDNVVVPVQTAPTPSSTPEAEATPSED